MTRVTLRLWRKVASVEWHYWEAESYVSYANSNRHTGDVYRFDGWRKIGDARAGKGGGTRKGNKVAEAKSIWGYELKKGEST